MLRMRSAAVLALSLLPLMLFFPDMRASAQSSGSIITDSIIKITLPQTSKSCIPAAKKTYSVRFHSLKAAGGTLYERKLISHSVLKYLQSFGAKNVTADVFSTCVNAAEKQKMNVFRYNGGVCTLYTVLPAVSLLSSCGNVGTVVVYMVKTSLNNATSPLPQIDVVNLTLDPKNRMLSAIWNMLDSFSFTEKFNVTLNNVTVIISLTDTSLATTGNMTVSIGTFQLILAGTTINGIAYNETTYRLMVPSPALCTNTFVSVTPLNAEGRSIGATITENKTTWPNLSNLINCTYDSLTLDNFTISWDFPDCGQAGYMLRHAGDNNIVFQTFVNKSTTSLTLLGIEVCTIYKYIYNVNALDLNNNTMLSTYLVPLFDQKTSDNVMITFWPSLNACSIARYYIYTADFTAAAKMCNDKFNGELFKYGGTAYSIALNTAGINSWVDLQYSAASGNWIWGNGMVEPNNSSLWITLNPSQATCATGDLQKLIKNDCMSLKASKCFKIY